MDQEKIGKFIKDIRLKNNLSQQKFANKYGVTYQAVSKWENGKNIPDLSILKQICSDYNINLEDLLEAKPTIQLTQINTQKKKNIFIIVAISIIILILLLIYITFIITEKSHDHDFEFKTLSSTCENFHLYGSIAYNDNKTSIHISHITYCGGNDNNKYQEIECTLYETNQKTKTEISKYHYNENKNITLEEFLHNLDFKIDDYEKTCELYSENSLLLEINAKDKTDKITTYKIPLKLQESCSN